MTWLVTGGAGYIGAHVVRAFAEPGIDAVVRRRSVHRPHELPPAGHVPFVQGTILDGAPLEAHLPATTTSTGVVHLAGFKYAGVSVQRPLHTYEQNVDGTDGAARRDAADAASTRIVFSSSAAVYGTPDVDLVTEDTPKRPAVALRRVQAHRRVAAARPGPVASGLRHTQPALLQRRRLGHPRRLRHEPAQPLPARVRRAARGPHAARSTATTTRRPTARACATTSTSPTSPRRTSPRRERLDAGEPLEPRLQPRQRATASRSARSWTPSPRVTGIAFAPEIGPRRPGDPAAHRRLGRARGPRPRLADAALARRDGRERVGGAARGARRVTGLIACECNIASVTSRRRRRRRHEASTELEALRSAT